MSCTDGTIAETLTASISACRRLFRKEYKTLPGMPHIIRTYMNYRNEYQPKAARQRSQNDMDDFQEQQKWLDWDQFSALIARLRSEWEVASAAGDGAPTFSKAELHNLLLLGLYSCVPGHGNEVRLLQYILNRKRERRWHAAAAKITSLKKWVDKQKIN